MFSFVECLKLLPMWEHVIGWIENIFGGTKSQPCTGFTRTLTPTNFWILSGSNLSTKLMLAGSILRVDQSWAMKHKKFQLSLFPFHCSAMSVEFIPRPENPLKGWNFSSFHQTQSPCAWVGLGDAPNLARGTFHSLSISLPLSSQICSAAICTLKPVYQKKPRNTWMLFSSWHIWRTK